MPDLDHLKSLVTPATRALVVIDPNNPTGAVYPVETRRALLDFADRHGLLILADEVYGDLGFEGAVAPYGLLDPDAPIISFSSCRRRISPRDGARAGWRLAARRASTMWWRRCGSWRTDGSAAPCRCSMRLRRR
jgi:alanine-synthesizing transaminase